MNGAVRTTCLALLVAGLTTSCIPWPRKAARTIALDVAVTDVDGGAILDAQVTLIRFSFPHARVNESSARSTADGGVASWAEEREWETIWPLLPHGIPFYEFAWCAEAPSRAAKFGLVPHDDAGFTVTLSPGDGGCPTAQEVVDGARVGPGSG